MKLAHTSNLAQLSIFDPAFGEVVIGSLTVVVAHLNGQTLLPLPDVAELVGIPRNKGAGLLSAARKHGLNTKRDVVKLKPSIGQKLPMHFLRHDGLCAVTRCVGSDCSAVLRRWLTANVPGVEARFIAAADDLPEPDMESVRQRAYSAQLAAVIARHASPKELAALVRTLHGLKSEILAARYAPELNSSVYALYASYNMHQPAASGVASGKASP